MSIDAKLWEVTSAGTVRMSPCLSNDREGTGRDQHFQNSEGQPSSHHPAAFIQNAAQSWPDWALPSSLPKGTLGVLEGWGRQSWAFLSNPRWKHSSQDTTIQHLWKDEFASPNGQVTGASRGQAKDPPGGKGHVALARGVHRCSGLWRTGTKGMRTRWTTWAGGTSAMHGRTVSERKHP